jgi:hypothetical protein
MSMIDVALALAERFAVLPVWPVTKRPCIRRWQVLATRDPATVTEFWHRFPEALPGVLCRGALTVLDIDAKHPEAVAWLDHHRDRLPRTRTHRTRSGGWHLLYQHREGLHPSVAYPVVGIDVRARNSMIVWWPATGCPIPDNTEPAAWPDWLTSMVQRPRRTLPATASSTPSNPSFRSSAQILAALAGIIGIVRDARDGERNCRLYWAACRMRERILAGEITEGSAHDLLLKAAIGVGLEEGASRSSIASAWRPDK